MSDGRAFCEIVSAVFAAAFVVCLLAGFLTFLLGEDRSLSEEDRRAFDRSGLGGLGTFLRRRARTTAGRLVMLALVAFGIAVVASVVCP